MGQTVYIVLHQQPFSAIAIQSMLIWDKHFARKNHQQRSSLVQSVPLAFLSFMQAGQ